MIFAQIPLSTFTLRQASRRSWRIGQSEPVKVCYMAFAEALEGRTNTHPTLKPVELMRYLCRLTRTPTGGTVLDPFMGSGSTGVAAILEGRNFVGIDDDSEPGSCETARLRIEHALGLRRDVEAGDRRPGQRDRR